MTYALTKSTPRGSDRAAIVAAAFELLTERGFAQLDLFRLARRMGIGAARVRRVFSHQDLIEAMANAMMRAQESPLVMPAPWQALLVHRARTMRAAMHARRDGLLVMAEACATADVRAGTCLAALASAGFAYADARRALDIVDRFARDVVAGELGRAVPGDADARFDAWIETVVGSLSPCAPTAAAEPLPRPRHPDELPLREILRMSRRSADLAGGRILRAVEMDRTVLVLLEQHGNLSSFQIAAVLGADKAQVSRSVTQLEELELVRRASLRSELTPTPQGRDLGKRLLQLAELQNRELTFQVDDYHLAEFFAVVENLTARAASLLEREQHYRAEFDISSGRTQILPPLIKLGRCLRLGKTLVVKRSSALSNLEFAVLDALARHAPIDWQGLVGLLGRDQNQLWRSIRPLVEDGLVQRAGQPGRRQGVFTLTAGGRALHDLLQDAWAERTAPLFEGMATGQLARFAAVLRTVARNAEAQLGRELMLRDLAEGRPYGQPADGKPWDAEPAPARPGMPGHERGLPA